MPHAHCLPAPPGPAPLSCATNGTGPASASPCLLALDALALALRAAQPPAAYRLSLDSGVQYRNVRHALQWPLRARVDTWLRLFHSLNVVPVAARCAADILWPASQQRVVVFDAAAATLVPPECATRLRQMRLDSGLCAQAIAARAGVSPEAVAAVEGGRGLMDTLVRVCAALELELMLALPPRHATIDALWMERSAQLLAQPAQFARGAVEVRSARASRRLPISPAAARD